MSRDPSVTSTSFEIGSNQKLKLIINHVEKKLLCCRDYPNLSPSSRNWRQCTDGTQEAGVKYENI